MVAAPYEVMVIFRSWKVSKTISDRKGKGVVMLSWALTFLVIALIAAALGFGGIAGSASYIAQVLFFVFLVLFVISLIVPRLRPPVA
jgi:uncharacterized membrane protein YtjA (UPF0391 family)